MINEFRHKAGAVDDGSDFLSLSQPDCKIWQHTISVDLPPLNRSNFTNSNSKDDGMKGAMEYVEQEAKQGMMALW